MEVEKYINSNFTSLEDLATIEAKIEELTIAQNEMKRITAARLSNTEDNTAKELTIDSEKLQDAVVHIGAVLSEIMDLTDIKDSCNKIEALIQEFGPVPLFIDLQGQLQTKLEINESIVFLEKCRNAEEKLNSGLQFEQLGEVSIEIEQLGQPDLVEKLTTIIATFRTNLESELKEVIRNSKWLSNSNIASQALTVLTKTFERLVELQTIKDIPTYPESWWALDLLLQPFAVRFNYHFNSPNKDTNKLSKPEWALNYVENFLDDNLPLLSIVVDDVFKPLGRIGTYEVITCVLQLLRLKINKMVHIIDENIHNVQDAQLKEKYGRLLSHLIFETSLYDQRLRNKYSYNPYITTTTKTTNYSTPVAQKWTGLTGDILLDNSSHTVSNWLNFENTLATKRFENDILGAEDAFRIDYDYLAGNEKDSLISTHQILRPTYSAYGVFKLINNLNTHFQTLTIVKFQLKYVSKIQLNILESYLEAIKAQYKIFLDRFSFNKSAFNMIPGAMNEVVDAKDYLKQDEKMLASLQKLTEIFCSTKFLIKSMEKWSEDLIFIQLWEMYIKLNSVNISSDDNNNTYGIFGNPLEQYENLLSKIMDHYLDFFKLEIKRLLKKYVNTSQWELAGSNDGDGAGDGDGDGDGDNDNTVPSSDLNPLIDALPIDLEIISKSVSQLDYFAISNNVVTTICDLLYEYIVTNNRFSRKGVNQLIVDFSYLIKSLQSPLLLNSRSRSTSSSIPHDATTITASTQQLSSDENESYVKIVQAIDLLDSMDIEKAILLKKQSDKIIDELRLEYGHKLQHLKTSEIRDLLSRLKAVENEYLENKIKRQSTMPSVIMAKLYSTKDHPTLSIPHQLRVVIGRSNSCDIKIQGLDVSSKHCEMNLIILPHTDSQKEYLNVMDLSSNGLYLNDEKMDKGTNAILKTGDKLTFAKTGGSYIFRYVEDGKPDLQVGKRSFFDDYILGKQLGSGHYAVVKEAKCKRSGEVVAVKIFHPNKTASASGSRNDAKLQQEMDLLLSINHPNIVQYRGHYIEPNSTQSVNTYLVLEKMNSGELFQRIINKTKLASDETRAIFRQLLSGLKYLHDRDIIHRDIKPENILLDIIPRSSPAQKQLGPWDAQELDVRVKIADFGLAKFIGELKFTNTLCGTPAYVAPEILRLEAKGRYSKKVDLWSSGVLLYVCLCGFPPFSDELAPPNMKEQILQGKFAFYSPFFDDIEDTVLDLITNLLQVDPDRRFDIDETLNHDWFTEEISEISQVPDSITEEQ
ncbi:hypothetical protein KGF56_002438 [Candida oxycetoniae]|uniref:Uncharacterized protein n=1 Tax=Candida oxycetoniae TaxID=497107 RepID=A0AAI9SXM0_9ASCO|nr:uncharacterized protein KGF56_002438 [Candida oxycetoniae]KAI3404735.2 hypothetical protein KGF56_002438 [Candida oxycetoniae]